jgi:hypothetical protein
LSALVGLAWERRGGPTFREAVEAIANWHDRRHIRAWERRQRQLDYLVQMLRQTDPARSRDAEMRGLVPPSKKAPA